MKRLTPIALRVARVGGLLAAAAAAAVAPLAAPSHAQPLPPIPGFPVPGVTGPWGVGGGMPWPSPGLAPFGVPYPGFGLPTAIGPTWMAPSGLGFPAPAPVPARASAAVSTLGEAQRRAVVSMQDFYFAPEELAVSVGSRVTWQNQGGTAHTATSAGVWDTGTVRPGQSWSAVFAVPGVFNYVCSIHPDRMYGRIVVEADVTAPGAPGVAPVAPGVAPAGPTPPGPTPVVPGAMPAPGSVTSSAAGPVSPALLLQQFAEAFNRGDASAAMALLTDNVSYQGSGACMLGCTGRASVQPEVVRAIAAHLNLAPVSTQVMGNTVTGQVQVTADDVRALGVQRLSGTVTAEARGDRLASFRVTLDPSDPQNQLAIQRYTAGGAPDVVAPAAPPAPAMPAAPMTAIGQGAAALRVVLSPQSGSSVTGEATLAQLGDSTTVTVALTGLAPGSTHTGHIHGGSCSGSILHALTLIRADSMGQGSATTTLTAPLDVATWWVQYHAAESPPGPAIACGQPTAAQ